MAVPLMNFAGGGELHHLWKPMRRAIRVMCMEGEFMRNTKESAETITARLEKEGKYGGSLFAIIPETQDKKLSLTGFNRLYKLGVRRVPTQQALLAIIRRHGADLKVREFMEQHGKKLGIEL